MIVRDHASMQVMYLITYVVFGLVLAVLALTLYARLKDGAPALAQAATVAGLVWAVVLVASGMVFNAGMAAVVGLHAPPRPRPWRPGRRSSRWLRASAGPAASSSAACGSCS